MARKMKDSGIEWIGEIPEGWEIKYFVQLFSQVKNKNIGLCEKNLLSLSYGKIKQKSIETVGGLLPDNFEGYNIIDRDDIVLRLTDLQNDQHSLRVGLSHERGIITSAYCSIRVRGAESPNYLYYYLHTFDIAKGFYGMGSGVRQGLNWDGLKYIKILLPPQHEQDRISVFLNQKTLEIDSMLSKTISSIEEYKKLKQAVITQAVTKGVRGEREMKDSKVDYIGQIPDEWVLCKLRNIGDAQNGISKASEFFGKGTPFVSYSDVYKNYSLPFSVSGLVESTPEEQERYSVKEGDIFFTRTSETIEEVGFSCVCEKDIPNATFAGFLIRVRPFSDELYTPYAKYYFRSSHLRFYLVKEMNLVTRASLGQSLLKSMPVLLPSLQEQKEIANYLDAKCAEIDGLIAKKEQLVKELESYKKSLIYEVVTGKREV